MKFIINVALICISIPILFLILFTPEPCEHEMGKIFAFQFQESTANSNITPFCKKCNHYFGYSLFRGTPEDSSYLEVIKAHIGEDEIIGGEYYTVTAIVTLADYNADKARISCKVQNEDVIVGFSVEFKGEFEDALNLIQEGDEITFRGRFYDTGCGFTDCELIVE